MAQPPPSRPPPLAPPGDQRIHLRVLSPGTSTPETVELRDVPLDTTILSLKRRIFHVAHSHPPIPSQRLIFAGRLLADDGAALKEAFGAENIRNNDLLTIHMVMRTGTSSDGTTRPALSRAVTPTYPPLTAPVTGARMSREPSYRGQEGRPMTSPQLGQGGPLQHGAQLAHDAQNPALQHVGANPNIQVQPMFQMAHQMANQVAQQMAHQIRQHDGRGAGEQGAIGAPAGSGNPQADQQMTNTSSEHSQAQTGSQPPTQSGLPYIPQPHAAPISSNAMRQHLAMHHEAVRRVAAAQQQHAQAVQAGQQPAMPFPIMGPMGQMRPMPPPSIQLAQSLANIRAIEQVATAPTTMYLLSSPLGPQAILHHQSESYVAQFPGPVNGTAHRNGQTRSGRGPATGSTREPGQQAPAQPALAGAPRHPVAPHGDVANANNAAAADAAPGQAHWLQQLLDPLWLLFRILIFAYFAFGGNVGWRRPLIMVLITLAFLLFRSLDARGGVRNAIRTWWNDIIGIPRDRHDQANQGRQPPQQQPAQAAAGPNAAQYAPRAPNASNAPHAPNAANVPSDGGAPHPNVANGGAQEASTRPGPVDPRDNMSPLRRRLRPFEEAAALFVASFWPGVGEDTIRQRREAEAQRRRAEADRQAASAAAAAAQRDGIEGQDSGADATASTIDGGPDEQATQRRGFTTTDE